MSLRDGIDAFLAAEALPGGYRKTIERIHVPLADHIASRIAAAVGKMLTVGLCGAQGVGKSTMVASLRRLLEARGLSVAVLSLDDLYLTLAERVELSHRVHPLFRTRGVPGTHDVELGLQTFARLQQPLITQLPSFNKALDERSPLAEWPSVQGPADVLLFEGWCVGARPQTHAALLNPVNALERDEDPAGTWRRLVNTVLAGDYQRLFSPIDLLVLLKAPSFEVVSRWRLEQEEKLRARISAAGGDPSRLLSEAQIGRFISHYQRLTSHIIEEMPSRADVVFDIDEHREMPSGSAQRLNRTT